ncbi:branched-chain amino acid aminotransferase [Nocardioides massiliensis]|uniref:aminodeoxychorismate lyase n=2 Tax=Nocardioides massiliensis TaxID=1325935 RepID=A0ABT9NQS8_9ACTN|nr:aminodeoxychorismate lyase [Nocardioides massiliensis]MDP9822792.1 branched-chain amino acid aminotransferase [Nocardioides massiliensis]
MRAWVNGQLLVDAREPAVAITDHGFTVGDGVFEAVKVVEGRPFALTRHLDRLAYSAQGMGLPPVDLDAVRGGVDAVLATDAPALGRLRITYTGGPAPMGSGRGDEPPTLVVAVSEMPGPAPSVAVVTVPWPRNERGPLAGLKTTSYGENVVALAYAAERDASEALFGNLAGNICEGTGTNVFYAIDGELRTPTLESGCLAGVTRALLLEWLQDAGTAVRVEDAPLAVLADAEEVFVVSTTRDVQPVHRLDDRTWDVPGPLTRRAQQVWRERETVQIDP